MAHFLYVNHQIMEPTSSFKELHVWQKAHQFVLGTYAFTSKFPREEIYGLTSQFRRASISIAANIAEGYAKRGKADKRRFYNIAQGSLEECRYYLILAKDLKFNEEAAIVNMLEDVSKMLNSYIRAIDRDLGR